nr:hypothetical protein 12 [Spirochaetaceae bacterium]
MIDERIERLRRIHGPQDLSHTTTVDVWALVEMIQDAVSAYDEVMDGMQSAITTITNALNVTANTEELNMSNYDHDLVAMLNSGMCEVHAILENALFAEDHCATNVYDEVKAERRRQDEKWGADRTHHPLEWLAILGEEVGEVNQAALEAHFTGYDRTGSWGDYRKELIQVAAVAIAMVECHDRAGGD